MINKTTTIAALINKTTVNCALNGIPVSNASFTNSTTSTPSITQQSYGVTWAECTFAWSSGNAWAFYTDITSLTNA